MTLKEKYELLLEKVIAHSQGKHSGAYICHRINELSLNGFHDLFSDFLSRKPSETQHIEFYNHPLFLKRNDSWWKTYENVAESNQQRILFLKKIISEL